MNVPVELISRLRFVTIKEDIATPADPPGGWLHTGDLARMDEDGCISSTSQRDAPRHDR